MDKEVAFLQSKLEKAFDYRKDLLQGSHTNAIRLFNGFLEGDPRWVIELFGKSLVISDNISQANEDVDTATALAQMYIAWLPSVQSILYKCRSAQDQEAKKGLLIFGDQLTDKIQELGVHHSINLQMNQDSSFYLDTRYLRAWLMENMAGKLVLNTFAYTGSLGLAALAGGAKKVVQTDLNRKFLEVAHKSCELNNFPTNKMKLIVGDFYKVVGNFKKAQKLFECVIIDPPFFSTTTAGRVDLVHESTRLVNKIRPLVAHDGYLVVVNNALFLSGQSFMDQLEELCDDRYMTIEAIIPVPQDVIGYPETIVNQPPVPTEPFNHSTKIVILKVKRKEERSAND
jgi:23S rRNA (cytosine1962-C5)-methyltransferase